MRLSNISYSTRLVGGGVVRRIDSIGSQNKLARFNSREPAKMLSAFCWFLFARTCLSGTELLIRAAASSKTALKRTRRTNERKARTIETNITSFHSLFFAVAGCPKCVSYRLAATHFVALGTCECSDRLRLPERRRLFHILRACVSSKPAISLAYTALGESVCPAAV